MKLNIASALLASAFLAISVSSASASPVSIRGVAITSDSDSNYSQVEGNNVAANFEDQRRRDGVNVKSYKEVNFDLEFPYGTGLSIIYTDPDDWQEEDVWYETKRTCEVRAGTNGKPMIKNDAPNGIRGNHWIRCAFHVVFPGHSDGCDCDLTTTNADNWHYKLGKRGCDCLRITGFECDSGCPTGLVWPCQENGCFSAPQMKIHVDAK